MGSNDQVADVPLPDARENHQRIIAEAQRRNIRVLLLTEYVQEAQRNRLFEYAAMQRSFQGDQVRWFDVREVFKATADGDSLADRNHLSRLGNKMLGHALAAELKPWVYGSSR